MNDLWVNANIRYSLSFINEKQIMIAINLFLTEGIPAGKDIYILSRVCINKSAFY